MLKEFKEFIARGSVIDLAVGMIMGSAFSAIVKSLVDDIISPFIGLLLGKADLSGLMWTIKAGELNADGDLVGAVIIKYGAFLQSIISFLIIAFVIFMVIKAINKLKRKEEVKEEEAVKGPSEVELLTEILNTLEKK